MTVSKQLANHSASEKVKRLQIAFFDYPDVFEDFYPHYGVTQQQFATTWHNTGNHAWLKIVEQEIGDVTWYVTSIKPLIKESRHEYIGCRIKFLSSSWLHRQCWRMFYKTGLSWRWRRLFRTYATVSSYLSLLSFSFFRKLKKDKPDMLFVQEYCSGRFDVLIFFARLLKIPILVFHAGSTPDKYLGKFLKRYTIHRADWIFSSGNNESNILLQKFKVSPDRLNIIRPPIDVSIYTSLSREKVCSSFGLDAKRRYWLFTGRLDDSVKRVSSIIDKFMLIAKEFSTIDLLIVGTGKDEDKLKQMVTEPLKHRIRFLGWIADDEKKAVVYNIAECLILASRREGFPTVVGEAFSCGVPVVSSRVGAIEDVVIPGKSGWLFPAEDDEAMQRCFLDIAANPGKVAEMKPVARTMAEEMVSFEAITCALKKGFSAVKKLNE